MFPAKVLVYAVLAGMIFSHVGWAGQSRDPFNDGADDSYWIEPMQKVHEKFTGQKGTFAHFGDSITVTLAYWTPLLYSRNNCPPQMERAYEEVKKYLKEPCWRQWKGANFGSESGQTVRWALKNIDSWLSQLKPEVAMIMFGTNDLNSVPPAEFRQKMRQVVQKCLDNGTVVILSTIPPRHGFAEKAADYNDILRTLSRQMKLPLIDFHAEILNLRPDDWDGATDRFASYNGYDVPTLLARDGVHPSNPQKWRDDYSTEGLSHSGYVLRNYLSLMKYAEVLSKLELIGDTPDTALKNNPVDKTSSIQKLINQDWFPKAPALPKPNGKILKVSTPRQLIDSLNTVEPGGTILLEDGHYMMPRYVAVKKDNVTLRSASGNRNRVIIDGAQSQHGELIGITACSGVTIAGLTIQNIKWNGFKINSETNVQKLTIYNCVIHNIWQRGVKGVKVPLKNREQIRPKDCRISYCLFYNDRAKRFTDDPADTSENFNGDYIGGLDVMYAKGWTISDNVFVGIQGRTRQGRGAVFLWHDSQNCVVERNIIIDCDAGVCLGNPHRPSDIRMHCTGCVVKNNFITRAPEAGIVTVYTRDCKILHNSILEPNSKLGRLIRVVFDNENLFIANNLLSGSDIRIESKNPIRRLGNLRRDNSSMFVSPENGNLHLSKPVAQVVEKAVSLVEVPSDIDAQRRSPKPDIGADEID